MVVVHIYLQVKPDRLADFKAAILTNARASRLEPGNLRFDVLQHADDETAFTLVEIYRDEAARNAHYATDHFKAWREASADFFTAPRTNQQFKMLFPDNL